LQAVVVQGVELAVLEEMVAAALVDLETPQSERQQAAVVLRRAYLRQRKEHYTQSR